MGKAHAASVTDVDFRILPGTYVNPVSAILSNGNDSVSAINALFPGDAWTQLDKTDGPSTVFNGVTFVLTSTGSTTGTWQLAWSGPGLPITMEFVFVTKAANYFSSYLFAPMTFTSDPLTGDGRFQISWSTSGVPGGSPTPGLSHASIYGRIVDEPPVVVPVPGSLPLLGFALVLLGTARARRRR